MDQVDTMDGTATTATPKSVYIVGVLSLLWSAFGCYDYLMTKMRDTDYLASMMPGADPNAILAWIDGFPVWAQFGWGLGVWGGLVGSALLLIRSRWAVPAFLASLIGAILGLGYQLVAAEPMPGDSGGMMTKLMPIIIIAIAVALCLYARAMRGKGVLR